VIRVSTHGPAHSHTAPDGKKAHARRAANLSRCSSLKTRLVDRGQQRDAAQHPLHRALVCLEVDRGDEVQARTPGRAVDRARVDGVALPALVDRAGGGNVQHRQRRIDDLGVRVGQDALALVPLAAVEEEAVDVDALRRAVLHLVPLLLEHLVGRHDVIERPAIARVLAAHVLPVGGEEARRVEEAGQPEAERPAVLQPCRELLRAVEDVGEPHAHVGRREVGDLRPARRHARHEERVERLRELGRHDDGAGDGQLERGEVGAQLLEHLLQPVDLLLEANVERLAEAAERFQLLFTTS